jgi:hypothetical protein
MPEQPPAKPKTLSADGASLATLMIVLVLASAGFVTQALPYVG